VQSDAYLTEAEGHLIATTLGITVPIHRGAVPPGFRRVENPGAGHCLIHALAQAAAARRGQEVPRAAGDADIPTARGAVADDLPRADVLALCAAAVFARFEGRPEPGLGQNMRALLNSPAVMLAAARFVPAPPAPSAPSSSGDGAKAKEGEK